MQNKAQGTLRKRTLGDALLLWGAACFVAVLIVGFFLAGDNFDVPKKLQLYIALNASFCLLAAWRFRGWFKLRAHALFLIFWLVAHLMVYAFFAYVNLNFFFYIFLFPVELSVLRWIELRRAAIHREKELKHADDSVE